MTNTTDKERADQVLAAAGRYSADQFGSLSLPHAWAFVAGVKWQREQQEDYDAFNGRLGPSDDAWRATLQATINQQAEEIERLREAERRLIAMVKFNVGAA